MTANGGDAMMSLAAVFVQAIAIATASGPSPATLRRHGDAVAHFFTRLSAPGGYDWPTRHGFDRDIAP